MPEPKGWTLVQPAAAAQTPAAPGWTLVEPAAPPSMQWAIVNGQRVPVDDQQTPPPSATTDKGVFNTVREAAGEAVVGAAKGVGQTIVNVAQLPHRFVPGFSEGVDSILDKAFPGTAGASSAHLLGEADRILAPTNTAQTVGKFGEQVGEYFIPGSQAERWATNLERLLPRAVPRIVPRMAVESGINAGVTGVHGGNIGEAAVNGALVPVAGAAASKAVEYLGTTVAGKLVRSGLKPTVAAMKRVAGASMTGVDAQAKKLVDFILEHRLTSPDKAQAVIDAAETELRQVLRANRGVVTDAPQRAQRYLQAIERSAARQGLPADDVAIIRAKAQELLNASPLSEDVTTTVLRPGRVLGPNGQPALVPTPVTTRALRTDVKADEALDLARGSGQWGNRKAWGEQKGAAREASKAVERATRDAVKDALPATRAPLQRQQGAITAREALDRKAFRQANREGVGLPAHALVAGGQNVLALASSLLRDKGLQLGVYARMLRDAVATQNVQKAAAILTRLGVSATEQSTVPQRPISAAKPGGRIVLAGVD